MIQCFDPNGVAVGLASIPLGFHGSEKFLTGGIAVLNPRLIAGNPPG